jgi:hypothetical protein
MAVVVLIIAAGTIYLFVSREKPAKPKPPPPPKLTITPQPTKLEKKGIYIPPEVPRTVGTIKQMAEEDPALIESVVRAWIKGGIAPTTEIERKKKKPK